MDITRGHVRAVVVFGLAGLALVSLAACAGQEGTATATPGTQATPTPGAPPDIPRGHSVARCGVCHELGIAGVPRWPDDHAGFTEQECEECHQAARP